MQPDSERIVLCDESGIAIGSAPKLSSHHESTPLHLAFSCYIFDKKGRFLLTRRARTKKVWPGVWTNSVCGHPQPEESMESAIERRAQEELGMTVTSIRLLVPDYRYITPPYYGIIENEFCPIFVAYAETMPNPAAEEVEDFSWVTWENFLKRIEADSDDYSQYAEHGNEQLQSTGPQFSWWCKDQASQIKSNPLLLAYAAGTTSS